MKNKNLILINLIFYLTIFLLIWINFFIFVSKFKTIGNENDGIISSYILITIPLIISIVIFVFLYISSSLLKLDKILDSNNLLAGTILLFIITTLFTDILFIKFSYIIEIDLYSYMSYLLIISFYYVSILCFIAATGKILGLRLSKLKNNLILNKKANLYLGISLITTTTISLIISFFVIGWLSLLISFLMGIFTILVVTLFILKKQI